MRLAPGGPVARVGGLTASARDVREHFGREVELTRWLARAGAPCVRPWEPAGPHERDGFVVTLWEAVPDGPAPPAEGAGRALRACHEALASWRGVVLPSVAELLGEALGLVSAAAEVLGRADRLLLRGALLRASAEVLALGLPEQPLHGDAGVGNVLPGPLWNDWEDCCRGPVAWDLACLVSSPRVLGAGRERAEAALVAYGPFPGSDRLDVLVHARAAQVAAWSAFVAARWAGPPTRLADRLAWLRAAR